MCNLTYDAAIWKLEMQHFLGWYLEWTVQNCLLCQVLLSWTNAFPFDFWGIVVLKLPWKFVLLSSNQFKAFNFYQIVQFLSFSGARWEGTFSVYMCQSYIYIKLYKMYVFVHSHVGSHVVTTKYILACLCCLVFVKILWYWWPENLKLAGFSSLLLVIFFS